MKHQKREKPARPRRRGTPQNKTPATEKFRHGRSLDNQSQFGLMSPDSASVDLKQVLDRLAFISRHGFELFLGCGNRHRIFFLGLAQLGDFHLHIFVADTQETAD